jgi:site-specific DNA-methyltransferase (adenine-specific)
LIATIFNDEEGSIWFKRTEHTWAGGAQKVITVDEDGKEIEKKLGGKCKHCGASQSEYERDKTLESHAYALIHTEDPKQLIKQVFGEEMQFDVIIGNPPYQLSDGGGEGSSAIPLYHHFVEQAIKLEPRMLTMIIPARWYSGGKGLDDFRQSMMSDKKLALINDYPETDMVFPGQNIRGGVCVFLRNEAHEGPATITNFRKSGPPDEKQREISIPGVQTFVRYNKAISILEKVRKLEEQTLDSLVLSRNPFGIPSNFSAFSADATEESNILLYRSRRGSSTDKEVYISLKQVGSSLPLVDKIKVLVSKASPGGDEYPHAVIGQPIIAGKNTASTETYLVVSTVNSMQEGSFLASYMSTRFFRFLVSLIKNTQNISKGSFAFVPVQKLDQHWTDEALYKKYGITKDEIEFIESLIRPKEVVDE